MDHRRSTENRRDIAPWVGNTITVGWMRPPRQIRKNTCSGDESATLRHGPCLDSTPGGPIGVSLGTLDWGEAGAALQKRRRAAHRATRRDFTEVLIGLPRVSCG